MSFSILLTLNRTTSRYTHRRVNKELVLVNSRAKRWMVFLSLDFLPIHDIGRVTRHRRIILEITSDSQNGQGSSSRRVIKTRQQGQPLWTKLKQTGEENMAVPHMDLPNTCLSFVLKLGITHQVHIGHRRRRGRATDASRI